MKQLAIIGASDLARLIAYHAFHDGHYKIAGFYDDYKKVGDVIDGISVLGGLSEIEKDYRNGRFDCLMSGIGYRHMDFRKSSFAGLRAVVPFGTVIHSSCYIDRSAIVGQGCFLLPGCVLDRNVLLHENVLLNTGCVIAHDSSVESHSFLSPAVKMAGFSKVGSCCNIGINTTIIDNITICDGTQTAGGAVVIKSITEPGLYMGIPAKKHIKL